MPSTPPGSLRMLGRAALLAALVATFIGYAQAPAPGLYGYDGYFHIRYASLGFQEEFPWWQETFLAHHYADKDLLFHALLGPLAHGDLEAAGKRASILFATALYLSVFLSLTWARCGGAFLWTMALAASSTTLLYRSGLLRSHVLAISIAMLGTAAIVRGRRAAIAILSAAYALTHIAWHLLPGIAVIHDLILSIRERRPRLAATAYSLAGTLAGILLNPYFPDNLRLWYVQNVQVLIMSWTAPVAGLGLGLEILPGPVSQLLSYNPGPVLFTLAGIAGLIALRDRRESLPGTATAGAVAVGFLGLSLLSRRFVEFWAPMSVLFAALAWSGYLDRLRLTRAARWSAGVVLAGALGFLGWHAASQTRRIIGDDPGRIYAECAGWIRDNAKPGAIVFTSDWDEFPELFFTAPDQFYLSGLDPTFMYVTSPPRWRRWRDVVEGRVPDMLEAISGEFDATVVFADSGHETFEERADQEPGLRLEVSDLDCSVYSVKPGAEVDAGWGTWEPWRADGGPPVTVPPGNFVNLETLLDPAAAASDCATVTGSVTLPGESNGRLSFVTDDVIRILVDDREVFDSRVAAAPSLDEALEQRHDSARHPLQRSLDAVLHPGYNAVSVITCRAKHVWGFHMWAEIGR